MLFQPFTGKSVNINHINPKLIDQYIAHCFKEKNLEEYLPPDSLIMLEKAAPMRLKRFLNNQPEKTHIVDLENRLKALINAEHGLRLEGVLDRIDLRMQNGKKQIVILDYKTGRLPIIKNQIWYEEKFWTELENFDGDEALGEELLMQLTENFESIQLPCYMHLCKHNYSDTVYDAGYVGLAESGHEKFMLGDDIDENERSEIVNKKVPILLNFITTHMIKAKHFFAKKGKYCDYCAYGSLCQR